MWRCSAVVGIHPNRATTPRLLGALVAEQRADWWVGRRSFIKVLVNERQTDTVADMRRGSNRDDTAHVTVGSA